MQSATVTQKAQPGMGFIIQIPATQISSLQISSPQSEVIVQLAQPGVGV
jgi:hypothetical protein